MTEFVERGAHLEDSEAGITRLVEGLCSLTEGELSVAALIAHGQAAVPALRRALLEGTPSTVYLPRQRMVRTLAELGAFPVLSEYLLREKSISDPVLRLAEEAVENTAARELGRCLSDENFYVLRAVAIARRLPGAVEALAQFRREAGASALVAALESDFCRNAAADGIRVVYEAAMPHLIESVRSPEPSRSEESPTSLRRRQAAARLLAENGVGASSWQQLEFLLYESDEWLQCCGAEIEFRSICNQSAVRILLKHVTSRDWVLVEEISRFLRQHLSVAKEHIIRELEKASAPMSSQEVHKARLLRWILQCEGSPQNGEDHVA